MRTITFVGVLLFAVGSLAQGQPTKKLETNANFEDLLIQGKYQFSDEAITTVEEDKVLDSLLGVRKDFRDRLERSSVKR